MIDFTVDAEMCIHCGQCARDCVASIITMDEGIPSITPAREEKCLQCLHCLAVCPVGAISILGKTPENSLPLKGMLPPADQMERLLKGRRSIRHYKQENVDPSVLARLMEITMHAPTAKNVQALQFTLVDNIETMHAIREATYKGLRERMDGEGLPAGMEAFGTMVKLWERRGTDIIFRNAPHMLWVTTPVTGPAPTVDPVIALSYFELMAASLGIGSVWCGYANWTLSQCVPSMKTRLGIPEDHTNGYVIMFGLPDVRYFRTVQRATQNVHRVVFP